MQTSHNELQKQKIARQLLEVQLAFVDLFQQGFSNWWKATVLPNAVFCGSRQVGLQVLPSYS